jgi:hypothetical protein
MMTAVEVVLGDIVREQVDAIRDGGHELVRLVAFGRATYDLFAAELGQAGR